MKIAIKVKSFKAVAYFDETKHSTEELMEFGKKYSGANRIYYSNRR